MKTFFMDRDEQEYIMSFLNKDKSMLEYGSGLSTTILQDEVGHLTSVEHDEYWYKCISNTLNDDVTYLLKEPENKLWELQFDMDGKKNIAGDDGTFEDFASYIMAPLKTGRKYDIIFIDGRARVACSAFAVNNLLADDGTIFIHDFGPKCNHPTLGYRTYYDIVTDWLDMVGYVGTMYRFKKRKGLG